MANVTERESQQLEMTTERLAGRTQQVFFDPEEDENFCYSVVRGIVFAMSPSNPSRVVLVP